MNADLAGCCRAREPNPNIAQPTTVESNRCAGHLHVAILFFTVLRPVSRLPPNYVCSKDIGNSISAIAFFQGRLYAADYSKKCLWFFDSDSSGSPDLTKPKVIAEGMGAEFVDLVRYRKTTESFARKFQKVARQVELTEANPHGALKIDCVSKQVGANFNKNIAHVTIILDMVKI